MRPVKRNRVAAVRRLFADLRRSETRGAALRRVRRRATPGFRGRNQGPAHTDAASVGVERPDSIHVGDWSRLADAVYGPESALDGSSFDRAMVPEAVKLARRHRAKATLAEAIARGERMEVAVHQSVTALTGVEDWPTAWAVAEGVGRLPGGATASVVGHAVLLHRRGHFDRVWNLVRDLSDETLSMYLPVEAVDAALADGTAPIRVRALAIGVPTEDQQAHILVDLAGRFLVFGERERAAALVAELRRRSSVDLDERRRQSLTLIEGWLDRRPISAPAGSVPIAVMDYRTPDHVLRSGNLGDYIQTLSLAGNLARLSNVKFSGEDGLGELATELQERVQPELRLPQASGSVHLIGVDRDFSSATDVPVGTWMIAFGWHMHPLYDIRYDFPYHPNVRPLFISFHVNRLDMLSESAQAYLREYGPVGCRDWNTVFLLLSAGIDAFFTGCLTTTVDALFPSRESAYRGNGAVGVIDLPRRSAGRSAKKVRVYSHQSDDHRYVSLADGLRAASAVLGAYQQDLERVVTGRLHAYLPLTSLGVPVEFKTTSPGDVRLAGLTGLHPGDERLTELRRGIRDLISRTLEKVLAGSDESEVYGLWQDLTRELVAEARTRFEAPAIDPPTSIDVAAAVAVSWAGSRRFGPHETVDPKTVTDIVISFDQNLKVPAAVLIESVVANASGSLRLWVLARGLSDAYLEWLAAAFPSVPMTILPCDQITYGSVSRPRRIPARITISTMDRLLLPNMLDAVDRVLYLDVDTLVLGDVCSLAATDLGDRPVAARDSNVSEASEWRSAGRRLAEAPATDLRRWMGFRHGYGGAALNAGVLVMDLDRMRRDGFTATCLAWVERYGLNDQDSMLAYVGPNRVTLAPRWNTLPVLEDVSDPSLIHWASLGKPWEPELTYGQDRWRDYAERLHQRAGWPPPHEGANALP